MPEVPAESYRILLDAPGYFYGSDESQHVLFFTGNTHKNVYSARDLSREFVKSAPAVVTVLIQTLPSGEIHSTFKGLLSDAEWLEQRKLNRAAIDLLNWDSPNGTKH